MYLTSTVTAGQPGVWEQKLAQERDSLQRVALLNKMVSHYAYTNVRRAKELLDEQWELLQVHEFADFTFQYYLQSVVVLNQLYEFEQAEARALQAIAYLEEAGSTTQLAEMYVEFAGVCRNLGKTEAEEQYLQRATKMLKQFPDQHLHAHIACRKGYMHLHAGNNSFAKEQFLTGISMLDDSDGSLKLREQYVRSLLFAGLGQLYERNSEYQKSVNAFWQVIELCERLGMTNRLAWHYLNVGRAYLGLEEDEKAKECLQKVIDTRDDLSLQARAGAYANLGYCSFEEGDYDRALELLQRAEDLHRELDKNDFANLCVIASWRGRILTESGDYEAALNSFHAAIDLADAQPDFKMLADIHGDIAAMYADVEQYQLAYEHQLEHDRIRDFYLADEDRQQQQELEVKYQAARKQQEAELLELKAARLQLKALRAQMNPHFIYNALNSIQHFITSNNKATASKYLAKFAKLMRQSLEYSDMEIISLEEEIEFLTDYLVINEKLRFEDRLSFRIIVDDDIEEDILGVPSMIIQPYVENALEHGLRSRKDGVVTVHFRMEDDETIRCVIEDNGVGRSRAREMQKDDPNRQDYRSRGTQITEKRLELLRRSRHTEVHVRTTDLFADETKKQPSGTRVDVLIPVVDI